MFIEVKLVARNLKYMVSAGKTTELDNEGRTYIGWVGTAYVLDPGLPAVGSIFDANRDACAA